MCIRDSQIADLGLFGHVKSGGAQIEFELAAGRTSHTNTWPFEMQTARRTPSLKRARGKDRKARRQPVCVTVRLGLGLVHSRSAFKPQPMWALGEGKGVGGSDSARCAAAPRSNPNPCERWREGKDVGGSDSAQCAAAPRSNRNPCERWRGGKGVGGFRRN